MDDEKRKTIVNEITHWRRSRLLPEQYCDFLLNLYRDENLESEASFGKGKASTISNSHWRIWLYGVLGLSLLLFLIFHFSTMSILLQMGVSCVFVIACYMIGIGRKKNPPMVSLALCLAASLILLVSGMFLISKTEYNEASYYVGYIAICAIIWLVIGIRARQHVLHVCGWFALLFVYGWLLNWKLEGSHWAFLQLGWLGLVGIFLWIGWLMHHRGKDMAKVLFIVSLVCWFVPEVMSMMTSQGMTLDMAQLLLFGKLTIGALLLFVLRKKWIEWVV
ncbi:hypothetical protein [Paenibacillus sp. KN14-4R]|uniref:hypothetical protein n=1 Tax=Paenibacillus sp. KN14-4R TaxID=3445773 RepID=UPI003F9F8F5A